MTTISGIGFPWPPHHSILAGACHLGPVSVASPSLNTTGERLAMMGHLYIDGRPTSAKTISSSGGAIGFRTGSVTWANAGTSVTVGIQGVSSSAGPIARPDGSFVTSRACVPGTTAITTTAWNTISMNSGSSNLTHGDVVAVVFDMTARAGSDEVSLSLFNTPDAAATPGCPMPSCSEYTAATWNSTSRIYAPNVVITFDDGTLATLDGSCPFTTITARTWSNASNPDEYGIVFQVPFDCEIDQFWAILRLENSSADGTITLYSDPFGTPATVASVNIVPERGGTVTQTRQHQFTLAAPVALTANTDYVLAMKATSTGTLGTQEIVLNAAASRALWPGGTTLGTTTRNNGSGAFAAATTTQLYIMGVRIVSVDTGGGSTYSRGRVVNAGGV